MKQPIQEYAIAFNEHLVAAKDLKVAEDRKRQTYYRLMAAKEELRAQERELLEDVDLLAIK